MKNIAAFAIATALLLAGGMGYAQDSSTAGGADDDTLELTMTLLPEGATLPDAVTKVISLPEVAADAAGEHAGEGLGKANEARAGGDEGLERAAEAREGGREFGQQMREQAQEDRENNGHGQPPEPPGRPDAPGNGNPGAPPGPP